jgi:glycosyltransferase involved in cell wall biosynthesis
MKILLVITKAEIGGAQNFVLSLAKGFRNNGQDVSVAFGEGNYLPEELIKEKIPFFIIKSLKRSKNPFKIIHYIFELKKLINNENFDVIHFNSTNTLPGVISIKLSKNKPRTVFTIHGLSVMDPNYKTSFILKSFFRIYFKFFLSFINKTVFVSKDNFNEFIRQGIKKENIIIYYGLDLKSDYFFDRKNARIELGKLVNKNLEGVYLIGSIGRLAEQKNYNFIIKNWLELKKERNDAELLIIGEGPERDKYENMIKEFNIVNDILLPGEIKDASRLLKGFDLFVLPSAYEGLPISLVEVIFSGIPVLASDVGGNREIIGIENCFELNNEKEFIKKFKRIPVVNVDESLFAADFMVKDYINIYEE